MRRIDFKMPLVERIEIVIQITPIRSKIPDHPGWSVLLIVDYCSKSIAIENLRNHLPETVIYKCKKVFSQFGIPNELITEDDPIFSQMITNFVQFRKLVTYLTNWLAPITINQMTQKKYP